MGLVHGAAAALLLASTPAAARPFRDVTAGDAALTPPHWYSSLGFDVIGPDPDGEVFVVLGAGDASRLGLHRLYRLEGGRFVERTRERLAPEWDRFRRVSGVSAGDLNGDGFDDLLFTSGKYFDAPHGYFYDPAAGAFAEEVDGVAFPNAELSGSLPRMPRDPFFEYVDGTTHSALAARVERTVVADLDGDGDEDVFVGTGGPNGGTNFILENRSDAPNGNTRFKIHALDAPRAPGRATRGVVVADLLGLGFPQVQVLAGGTGPSSSEGFLKLYGPAADFTCGCGNGVCEVEPGSNARAWDERALCPTDCAPGATPARCDAPKFVTIAEVSLGGTRAAAVGQLDLDGDRRPDVLVFDEPLDPTRTADCFWCVTEGRCAAVSRAECEGGGVPAVRNLAFRNAGEGRLEPMATPSAFAHPYRFFGRAAGADLDGDGLPELVTASHLTPQRTADGRPANVAVHRAAGGAVVALPCPRLDGGLPVERPFAELRLHDVTGDGALDLFVLGDTSLRLLEGTLGRDGRPDGCFAAEARTPPGDPRWKGRPVLADFDMDGDVDLFAAVRLHGKDGPWAGADALYLNRGGRFEDASEALADQDLVRGNRDGGGGGGAAAADFDGDGWTDLVVAGRGRMRLYFNQGLDWRGRVRLSRREDLLPAAYNACATGGSDACRPGAVAAADFDGNGTVDIAVSFQDGRNDILFNNLPRCPGCPPPTSRFPNEWGAVAARFLSARDELGFAQVLPTTDLPGRPPIDTGAYNRIRALRAADVDGDGRVDLVAAAAPVWGRSATADAVWFNHIAGPFPQRVDPALPNHVARLDFEAGDGWFRRLYLPARGDAHRLLGCLDVGDVNGDGRPDVVVGSVADDEAVPDLDGGLTLKPCDARAGTCDVVAVCAPSACAAAPDAGLPGGDTTCCRLEACAGTDCATDRCAGAADCAQRAWRRQSAWAGRRGEYATGAEAVAESRLLAWIFDPATRAFGPPVVLDEAARGAVTLDCAVGDLDGDGDADVAALGYGTIRPLPWMREARAYPLLTDATALGRMAAFRAGPRVLWNDGGAFRAEPLPIDVNKLYGVGLADIDADGALEIVGAGDGDVRLFDD